MLTATTPAAQFSHPVAQVFRQEAPTRHHFRDAGDYLISVIRGEVVTTPRTAVSLSADGTITIPILDEFA